MTLDTMIMLAGAFVAVLPFLGFPNSWDSALLFIVGALVVVLGMLVRRERNEDARSFSRNGDTFVESRPIE